VANYLLDLADGESRAIDPLQMQKLVYLSEGWHLALLNAALVREQFEAWKRGPVVPDLYHALKHFGGDPIRGRIKTFEFGTGRLVAVPAPDAAASRDLVRDTWEVYKRYTGSQLVTLTHERGSPWDVAWRRANGAPDERIEKEAIQAWFKEQAARGQRRNQGRASV
jgi:uncharacterized phage-associated protein